jgi:hypothetical protein
MSVKQPSSEKSLKLERMKIENRKLFADLLQEYIETFGKAIGVIGLTITTITQAIITLQHTFTGKSLASAPTASFAEETVGAVSSAMLDTTNTMPITVQQIIGFFTLPQYILFGLMLLFFVMIFIKKKEPSNVDKG